MGDLEFNDPVESLNSTERQDLLKNLPQLFEYLDSLWDAGKLPQKFDAR